MPSCSGYSCYGRPTGRCWPMTSRSPTRSPTVPDGCCARARTIFEASGATAARLYALLGDTLNRKSTLINERLTLVAVVFFPLTVSTGFFGMNFGWLVENIGSLATFLVFGILVPLALVGVTVVAARWLTRE